MADQPKASSTPAPAKGEPARAAGINPKLIETVGVTLEAFLGDARITVAELVALKEGAVLPLDGSLAEAVELRLNGLPVGRGELVAAGDKFAVRLIEISK
ncbi:MAG TPA: FliM/FliN family flagellar motor switch protein [Allosphingosinicella sp.]|jgi:flagellar motor switch protein FliN/FliY